MTARIAFIADVHLANHRWRGGSLVAGVNTRARMILDALDAAVTVALKQQCHALVVCGDLFDGVRPEPQLETAAARIFARFAEDRLYQVFILAGNHDLASDAAGDHALGPLGLLANVEVVEQPCVRVTGTTTLWLVPYRQGNTREWLPGVLEDLQKATYQQRNGETVLALHAGIADADTPPWLENAHDAIGAVRLNGLMLEHDVTFAAAGNWHVHQSWSQDGCDIVQCGALVPTGFDNPGVDEYGSVIVWDGAVWQRHVVPGPRFVTVRSAEEYRPLAARAGNGNLFVRWKAPAGTVGAAAATLVADETVLGLAGGEAVPDTTDAEQAAVNTAATDAVAASTGDWRGAVGRYVDALTLEPGVDRERVRERVTGYLR
jgi:hypothetical protein